MNRIVAGQIGVAPREILVEPQPAALGALASRLKVPAVARLSCRLSLCREADAVMARGVLEAEVIQEDVDTLEPFTDFVTEHFVLRFVPNDALSDTIDPEDAIDEIGYAGGFIDLEEAMYEQLALALDPYPRKRL